MINSVNNLVEVFEHKLLVRGKYALFWNEWPSNWHPSPFKLNGKTYNCVEQHMMSEKAKLFNDKNTLKKIMNTSSPKEQKALGRKVKNFDAGKWSSVAYNIVLAGNLEKYRQNEDLQEKLIATAPLTLVEASPYDKIWGIGLDAHHKDAAEPNKWQGKNLLGKALTECRKIIIDAT